MHDFCRTLHTQTMADVRKHTTAEQRKATWAYKFAGRRPTFEWHGPDGYRWEGKADCLWDAKVKGWRGWMEKAITEYYQERFNKPPICDHDGEHCDGAEFCNTCQIQIFSGYVYGHERYCNDHKPAGYDAEVAEMDEGEFGDQDDMYWTQFEICDIFCECPTGCPCRPAPEALPALYDADRARSEEDNKTYTITHAQLVQIGDALSDSESLMEIDDLVEESRLEDVRKAREEVDSILKQESPRPTENYYGQAIGYCELCQDERLEWDLNEDSLCPLCEERAEGSE